VRWATLGNSISITAYFQTDFDWPDFVIAFWNHHPLPAVLAIPAAILLFAALIEFGIGILQADPA
jgi:hypothetical protein